MNACSRERDSGRVHGQSEKWVVVVFVAVGVWCGRGGGGSECVGEVSEHLDGVEDGGGDVGERG